jgi:hypothetical protein
MAFVEGDPRKERDPHCCNVVWQCGGRKSRTLLQCNVAITLKEIPHIVAMQRCNYVEGNLREEANSHCYHRARHYKGKRPLHVVVALKEIHTRKETHCCTMAPLFEYHHNKMKVKSFFSIM